MQVSSLTRTFKRRFDVAVSTSEIGLALNKFDGSIKPESVKGSFSLTEEQTTGIVEQLVTLGTLPREALRGNAGTTPAPPPAKDSKGKRGKGSGNKAKDGKSKAADAATASSTTPPGSALVWSPEPERPKGPQDEALLDWCRDVIKAENEIKAAARAGHPFRPHWEPSRKGTGIVYDDPLSRFLEPSEFSEYVPLDWDRNEIYAPREKLEVWLANKDQSFQWRSRELMWKFEDKLLELWCAKTHCRNCHQPLEGGLWNEVKQLLRGERFLPDTPGVPAKRLLRYPESHTWCVSIISELIQLEWELQDLPTDGPEATARRAAVYQALVGRVALKHQAEGATTSIVARALREIRRVDKERIQRAAS